MRTAFSKHTAINRDMRVQDERHRDFLIACPTQEVRDVTGAVNALYYLPLHYRLVITDGLWREEASREEVRRLVQDETLMTRVSFDSKTGASDRVSPFSFADVVLQPHGQVGNSAGKCQIDLTGLDSPEALASAILRVARA